MSHSIKIIWKLIKMIYTMIYLNKINATETHFWNCSYNPQAIKNIATDLLTENGWVWRGRCEGVGEGGGGKCVGKARQGQRQRQRQKATAKGAKNVATQGVFVWFVLTYRCRCWRYSASAYPVTVSQCLPQFQPVSLPVGHGQETKLKSQQTSQTATQRPTDWRKVSRTRLGRK